MSRPSQPSIRALEQARARLQEQLAASPEDPKLLQLCARTEGRLGRHEDAARLHQRAAMALRAAGDRTAEALACLEAARSYACDGQVPKARTFFQRAIALHELAGDEDATVQARLALARFELEIARAPAEARQQLERCVAPLAAERAHDALGWVHERLAAVLLESGELDGALGHAKAAVAAAANAKDRSRFGGRLVGVAAIHRALGNAGKARGYLERAVPHLRESADRQALLGALDALVELAVEQGDLGRAEHWRAQGVACAGVEPDPQGARRAGVEDRDRRR